MIDHQDSITLMLILNILAYLYNYQNNLPLIIIHKISLLIHDFTFRPQISSLIILLFFVLVLQLCLMIWWVTFSFSDL